VKKAFEAARAFADAHPDRPRLVTVNSWNEWTMPNRARDWFTQAKRNLEQAVASRSDERHEWACFAAQRARVLDSFYIPTRYPYGHPEGAPFTHYGKLQSEEAIAYAGEILAFVRDQMAGA
jgi:HEPN domain-containing protein